jgi:hypothetical protein
LSGVQRVEGATSPIDLAKRLETVLRPLAPDDRFGLDAWVRDQPRERLDDAVASLAGRGILQPAPPPGGTR